MWILIAGSPLEGFSYYGPFTDTDTAIQWAEDAKHQIDDWWLIRLEDPNPTE